MKFQPTICIIFIISNFFGILIFFFKWYLIFIFNFHPIDEKLQQEKQKELVDARSKIKLLQNEVQAKTQDIEQKTREIEKITQEKNLQYAQQTEKFKQAQSTIESLKYELNAKTQEVKTNSAKLTEELAKAQSMIETLKRQLNIKEQELEEKAQEYEEKMRNVKSEDAKQAKELTKAQSMIETLKRQLNIKEQELEEKAKEYEEKMRNIKSEDAKQAKELTKAQSRIETLKRKLNTKTEELEEKTQEFESNSAKQTKELAKAQSKIETLKRQLNTKTEEFEEKMQEYKSDSAKKTKELRVKYANIQEENANLKKELEKINLKEKPITNKAVNNIEILDLDLMNEYETIENIGNGASSRVVKVAKKEIYAKKIMNLTNLTPKSFRYFLKEYEIMNMLNHPNILKAYGIFLSDKKNPPAIILEYCLYNLSFAILNKKLSNVEISCAIYQIAEGMRYIHFNKIIHRDLKPSNILIASDGTIKVGDFGIAKLMSPDQFSMTIGVGTNKFMAPEIIAEDDDYNEKIDVYSYGVLVFYMLSGGLFPKIKTPQILSGKKAEIPSSFTNFAKEFINDCWNFKAEDRPSFAEICEMLKSDCSNMIQLTKPEKKEVDIFVKNHLKRIPKY